MFAISQHVLGDPSVLHLVERPVPTPGDDQVLVRVHAAGVNPADWKIRTGAVTRFGPPPFTLGLDFSGVVEATGEEVYGVVLPPAGAYAEWVAAPVAFLAPKPATLDHVHAAALPVAALTAWQPLAEVTPGRRVLIHAAAGGVGHLAVQIAKTRGAFVIGTASARNHAFLRALGVDEVVDYTTTDFTTAVKDVDVVIDPIGDDYGPRSLEVLKPDGVLIDVRGLGPDRTAVRALARQRGIRYVEFGFTPSGKDLTDIAALVDAGGLRVEVAQVLPLAEAAKAHELSETGRVRGKLVLTP